MRSVRGIRYLNEQLVAMHAAKKNIQIVVGGILTVFFIFGMVETAGGNIDKRNVPIYLVFLLPSLHLLFSGIRMGILIDEARQFENIFRGEPDMIMTVEELSEYFGRSERKVIRELDIIIRKGYLQNCSLKRGEQPCVIMYASDNRDGEAHKDERKKSDSPQTR
ncbi:MAG: hypothetical protein IKS48_04470 [Eubacterium sp.]|nr:hypothetical protein [Eubacterium sp.]